VNPLELKQLADERGIPLRFVKWSLEHQIKDECNKCSWCWHRIAGNCYRGVPYASRCNLFLTWIDYRCDCEFKELEV
jgi:hypothetical protein